jgi:hypothetical protein
MPPTKFHEALGFWVPEVSGFHPFFHEIIGVQQRSPASPPRPPPRPFEGNRETAAGAHGAVDPQINGAIAGGCFDSP